MDKPLKESGYFFAWVTYWICTVVGGFVLGAIAGAITGAILGASGVNVNQIQLICGVLGFLVSIPLSFIFFRIIVGIMVVKKVQANCLVSTEQNPRKHEQETHYTLDLDSNRRPGADGCGGQIIKT